MEEESAVHDRFGNRSIVPPLGLRRRVESSATRSSIASPRASGALRPSRMPSPRDSSTTTETEGKTMLRASSRRETISPSSAGRDEVGGRGGDPAGGLLLHVPRVRRMNFRLGARGERALSAQAGLSLGFSPEGGVRNRDGSARRDRPRPDGSRSSGRGTSRASWDEELLEGRIDSRGHSLKEVVRPPRRIRLAASGSARTRETSRRSTPGGSGSFRRARGRKRAARRRAQFLRRAGPK